MLIIRQHKKELSMLKKCRCGFKQKNSKIKWRFGIVAVAMLVIRLIERREN